MNMRNMFITFFIAFASAVFFAVGGSVAQAHVGESTTQEQRGVQQELQQSLDAVLKSQQAQDLSEVDCNAVDDSLWEEVGEALMGVMHPDPKEHALMDEMMGGEGSDSLRAAHILMGRRYAGCGDGSMGDGMMGMMGGMMMSGGMMGRGAAASGMMESGGYGAGEMSGGNMMGFPFMGGWLGMALVWIIVGAGFVWLIQRARGAQRSSAADPLTTLKQRYARGEISAEEFEQMKKNIQ